MTPTARSLKKLRDDGYFADVCERWLTFPDKKDPTKMIRIRKDWLGFADIIGVHPTWGFIAVQATDLTSVSKHIHKIEHMESVRAFVRAGGIVAIYGWGLKGPAGKRKTYQLREVFLNGEGAYAEKRTTDNFQW